jgi:hypothetical protein
VDALTTQLSLTEAVACFVLLVWFGFMAMGAAEAHNEGE